MQRFVWTSSAMIDITKITYVEIDKAIATVHFSGGAPLRVSLEEADTISELVARTFGHTRIAPFAADTEENVPPPASPLQRPAPVGKSESAKRGGGRRRTSQLPLL